MDISCLLASPRKKIKLNHTLEESASTAMEDAPQPAAELQAQSKEAAVGITAFVNPDLPGFGGILKKRYTDFMVNEILPSGEVIHLDNIKAPKAKKEEKSTGAVSSKISEDAASETPAKIEAGPLTHADPTLSGSASGEIATQTDKSEGVIKAVTQHAKEEPLRETSATNPAQSPAESDPAIEKTEVHDDQPNGAQSTDHDAATTGWQAFADSHAGFKLTPEHESILKSFFDCEVITQILALFNKVMHSPHRKIKDYGSVTSAKITDRELRTKIHHEIRRIFAGRLESYTNSDGLMLISAAREDGSWAGAQGGRRESGRGRGNGARGGRGDRGGRSGRGERDQGSRVPIRQKFAELGGDYLHFSVYKENKDTMEVISFISRQLQAKPQAFQFAGTKDRRGVTVQRVSVYRMFADRLAGLNRSLRNAKVGNFEYHSQGLELGELKGNEFVITLRDCSFGAAQEDDIDQRANSATKVVQDAVDHLVKHGFLNYFGLQRFGTFTVRTDFVGMKMLQGDFKAAVEAILDFSADSLAATQQTDPNTRLDKVSSDDRARALAINMFKTTGNSHPALENLPRKFSAESNIIRHLGSAHSTGDYLGALQGITRNLRLMYVHAYQSLIWNLAVSYRWTTWGDKVMEGDLVLVNEHKGKETTTNTSPDEVDEDGETIVKPTAEDRAMTDDDRFERARPLTGAEAESGQYSLYDIVMPTPGYDIIYPSYMVSFYETTMKDPKYGALDPHDMRRPQKDFSLSGSYRKILARPGQSYECRVITYANEDEQFVETDAQRLEKAQSSARVERCQENRIKTSLQETQDIRVLDEGEGSENGVPGTNTTAGKFIADDPAPSEDAAAGPGSPLAVDQPGPPPTPDKLAVVLKLQLGSSQYATMALRELMKQGGVREYKPDFGMGR